MTRLELYDTVVLKSDRQLVATVARTYHDTGHDQPLLDCLIVAHVPVNDTALASFVKSGYPPKDYVFVEFADQAQGSSLVHEDDVELLDRSFTLGDVVKREGSQMLGTVTNIAESYTLQPVWRKCVDTSQDGYSVVLANDPTTKQQHLCTDDCPIRHPPGILHPQPSELIANVPGYELKKAADALEGDYIIKEDWLGIIEDIMLTVTVMTEDGSIVVVHEPDDLYIALPDFGEKPLVSLPEFDPDVPRPDVVSAQSGFSTIPIPPDDFQSGQYVIAGRRNLRTGRWLRGEYNTDCSPRVLVLDARASHVEVRWLTCNAFMPDTHEDRPHEQVNLYENINTFPSRKELRRDKKVTILDQAKVSRTMADRRRNKTTNVPDRTNIISASDIRVGDHVKFRDQAGAAVKYQGELHDGVVHNRFERLMSTYMLEFDMNELKVIYSHQEVTVLWQDGSITKRPSRLMTRFSLFESDLAPTDIVVAREGMRQRSATTAPPERPWTSFNEMAFFEGQHDLKPQKVGIIQSVDPVERLARIRWFANPNIELLNSGHILHGRSRFGVIEDTAEDVSLYEVMKFPALERRLKDLVMVVPEWLCDQTAKRIKNEIHPSNVTGIFPVSSIAPRDLQYWLNHTAHQITSGMPFEKKCSFAAYRMGPGLDWVGDIVAMSLDGTITVRVNKGSSYQDILIEHDQIICFIDEAAISGYGEGQDDDSMDVDSFEASLDEDSEEEDGTASTISEHIEYEGGIRLDDDSDNENWEDADNDTMEESPPVEFISLRNRPRVYDDITMGEPSIGNETQSRFPAEQVSLHLRNGLASENDVATGESSTRNETQSRSPIDELAKPVPGRESADGRPLVAYLPSDEPQAFEVLDRDPPPDQFRVDTIPQTSSSFLKRIAKEQRILSSSLPPGEIYVRTYESRLDLVRCLIIGPRDTPYEFAPFLIDLHLGPKFPAEPPTAHFHSWTSGLGRINPNLYEEGKICLSLLGTWQGQSETEGWSEKATLLQLLVSLQGLVFVPQPFYNEAGFEGYAEDGAYKTESQRYSEKAFVMARRFVKHALESPVAGLEDALAWRYLPHGDSEGLLNDVIRRSHSLIAASQILAKSDDERLLDGTGSSHDPTKVFLKPLSRGAVVMLEKTIKSLESMSTTSTDGTREEQPMSDDSLD